MYLVKFVKEWNMYGTEHSEQYGPTSDQFTVREYMTLWGRIHDFVGAVRAKGNNTSGHGNSRMSDIVINFNFNIPSLVATFSQNQEVIKK